MLVKLAAIFFSMILVNNYVLVKFYGICPFLGVSKKLDSSVLAQLIHEAGNRVDGVKSVDSVDITEFNEETRTLHGEITITTEQDETVSFVF